MTEPKTNAISTLEETESLFLRFGRTRDAHLRERLIAAHQKLVRYLAGKFANRGEPLEDLVQVGMIGLINAVDRYDPERGNKFSTFATPTIVGEIRRHFRDKAWRLKVPRRLQELNQSASRAHEELQRQLGRPPTIQEVAAKIGAREEETLEAMELGIAYETVSLDSSSGGDQDSASATLADFIGAEDKELQALVAHGDLEHAIASLDDRERAVIVQRFYNDLSQSEVASQLQISQMHVSRLQSRALQELKRLMELDK